MAPQHSEPHSTSTACDPPTNDAANGNEDQSNATRRPPNWIPVYEAPLFTRRKLKVVCVGAGFSGLILAQKIRYQYQLADAVDLVIYEKNEEVGGTWWENRYPGIAWFVFFFLSLSFPIFHDVFVHISGWFDMRKRVAVGIEEEQEGTCVVCLYVKRKG